MILLSVVAVAVFSWNTESAIQENVTEYHVAVRPNSFHRRLAEA